MSNYLDYIASMDPENLERIKTQATQDIIAKRHPIINSQWVLNIIDALESAEFKNKGAVIVRFELEARITKLEAENKESNDSNFSCHTPIGS